ncbi:MAG: glycerol-3-phosphate dehydrogenase/oxidase [Planctomycetes bacterium]|nr:glycerol-3-phosphate dehydrogenase/oxidase [Planctomycetota bacterium]
MRTDPTTLHGRTFDLIVIGGGIHGVAIAREAAVRGATVALLEARDFANGTSSRSSRLIHGGLRYLANLQIGLVREALRERERLLRLAPHLVRPLPMLMPFFRDGGGRRWVNRIGTRVYGWLAGRSTLPGPESLSAKAALQRFPGLRSDGLRSGLLFFDAATQDTRLVLANAVAAARAGALLCNWCEVVGADGDGLRAREVWAGSEVRLRARHVVNAAGPFADPVRQTLGVAGPQLVRRSRGSHVVLAPRPGETALAAFLPDRRIQFVIPHDDGTLCGTTEVDEESGDGDPTVPAADVDYLLQALGFLLAPAPTRADLRFAYSGWRSLPSKNGPAGNLAREASVITERLADGELHTIVGGKLTTHRSLAERLVARLLTDLEPSPTRTQPLPGGDGPRVVQDPLWWRHGCHAIALRAAATAIEDGLEPLCPHRPFLRIEAVYALRELAAVTFADLMLRRLVHSQGPCLQPACLHAAHELFVRHRSWRVDDERARACAAVVDEVRQLSGGIAEGT